MWHIFWLSISLHLGHISKDPCQMEIFFMKVGHLCQPQMSSRRNLLVQLCRINGKEKKLSSLSHPLRYYLLKLTYHFQGFLASPLAFLYKLVHLVSCCVCIVLLWWPCIFMGTRLGYGRWEIRCFIVHVLLIIWHLNESYCKAILCHFNTDN